jgi:hypothetical protein
MRKRLIFILTLISIEVIAQLSETKPPLIKLNDIEIKFNDVVIFLKESDKSSTNNDTAELYLGLGETIQGQFFEIVNTRLRGIKVEQQYETSLSISNEGSHLDLFDWKHHTSNWIELNPVDKDKYITMRFSIADQTKFPDFTEKELIKYLISINLQDWANFVKVSADGDGSKNCWIGLSRVTIRISGFDKNNNWVARYINIEIPMGC